MNNSQPHQDRQTFVCPHAQPFVLELAMGSVGINSVQVYNTSNAPVDLYTGTQSPSGTPAYSIPANGNVTVNPGGMNYITAVFRGTSGNVTMTWTEMWLVAMATSVPTAPVTQSQAVALFTPLAPLIAAANGNTGGQRNYNAVSAIAALDFPGTPARTPPGPPAAGQFSIFYIERVIVKGLPDYTLWVIPGTNTAAVFGLNELQGYGDGDYSYDDAPITFVYQATAANGIVITESLVFNFYNTDDLTIGTSRPWTVIAQGYVQ